MRKMHKSLLPTYDVFDEDRYFEPGAVGRAAAIRGRKIGVTICEDIWTEALSAAALLRSRAGRSSGASKGPKLIVNLSASPFSLGKPRMRRELVGSLARDHQVARSAIATRSAATISSSSMATHLR